ncbi:MAG: sensor histidine kinase N-terminal domain-containing protein [Burkholderiaceae bacterium]
MTDPSSRLPAPRPARRLRFDGRPSIRRSLVAWLIVPLAALVPATALLFYRLALTPALDSLDHALDGTTLALERLVAPTGGGVALNMTPELDGALRADRYDTVRWVVLGPDGRVVGGDRELARIGGPPSALDWHFFDAQYRHLPVRVALHSWRCVPGAPDVAGGRCEARVAETLNKRRGVKQQVLAAAASAMLAEALVLAVMGWVAIARSLRSVERLSKDIERRSPNQLGPVDRPDIPREVAPLVTALNGLFARVVAAAATEKAFLADAAHQLRTPLTALRTETELALMEPHSPQHDGLLRRLHQATTRATRLAHQLLSQARTDHGLHNSAAERVDLKQIATEAAEEWVGRSVEAGVDLGFELEAAPIDGHGFLLREVLANLLDNAIRYAGSGARVTIRTGMLQSAAGAGGAPRPMLEVEDNGPGIAEQDRERAFERFQRGSRGGGSGLGLSIVRDIVNHHQARIELLDGPGGVGLRVRMVFRAPGPAIVRGVATNAP